MRMLQKYYLYLCTAEAPVRVEQEQVGLLAAVGHDGVGVGLVGDALLVEDVLPGVTRPEVLETVAKQVLEMVKRIAVPVVLAVVVLLVSAVLLRPPS